MTPLHTRLQSLCDELRAVAEVIDYQRQGCAVSHAFAQDLDDMAEEIEDFSLAIEMDDQEETRH